LGWLCFGRCGHNFDFILGLILKTIAGYFRHWYFLLVATLWCVLAFARAAYYFKYKAFSDLQLPHPELLTSKEKRRLKHYFYGTTYLSIIFCSLRGSIRSKKEKNAFTNLAALAYFFDDLVDTFQQKDQSEVLWQNNPEEYGKAADERGLALHFLTNVYKALPVKDLAQFKGFMHQVFNVETAGRQQKETHFSEQEISQITAEKGGNSVLMFRRVLQQTLSESERNALYQFGFLIQMCDDIFDIWFDVKDGITTLPLTFVQQNKIPELRQRFENQVNITQIAFKNTPYSTYNINTSLAVIHFIVTVTRVCLDHLLETSKKLGTLPLDNRNIMVVDMEKCSNRVKAAFYLLKI
jgi:hypothetical protein